MAFAFDYYTIVSGFVRTDTKKQSFFVFASLAKLQKTVRLMQAWPRWFLRLGSALCEYYTMILERSATMDIAQKGNGPQLMDCLTYVAPDFTSCFAPSSLIALWLSLGPSIRRANLSPSFRLLYLLLLFARCLALAFLCRRANLSPSPLTPFPPLPLFARRLALAFLCPARFPEPQF